MIETTNDDMIRALNYAMGDANIFRPYDELTDMAGLYTFDRVLSFRRNMIGGIAVEFESGPTLHLTKVVNANLRNPEFVGMMAKVIVEMAG